MKKYLMAFIAIWMCGFVSSAIADKSTYARMRAFEESKSNTPYNTEDPALRNSAHLSQHGYIPKDLRSKGGGVIRCTSDGIHVSDKTGGGCIDFKSLSDGSMWRIRWSPKEGDSVFKLTNGQPQLWTQYRPGYRDLSYASPAAQQYAAAHGGGAAIASQSIPQLPQAANGGGGQCDQLSGKARAGCELAASGGLRLDVNGALKSIFGQ